MKHKNVTRNALVTSILALLVCVSMLVGATFAWFTDEVTTGMNTIAAGNLDVELLANGTEVESTTKLFNLVDAQGNDTWWEPGMVVYENLQIKNAGTLALQYQMALNFGNENAMTDGGYKLSEVLKVAVIDKIAENATRAEVLAAAKASDQLGTLADFSMSGELEAGKSSTEQTVVIFWEPNDNATDNLYNANNGKLTTDGEPLHIEFGVNLQAYQKMQEEDSFGNTYDEDATIHSYGINNANEAFEVFSTFDQSGNRGAVYLNADYNTSDADEANHWSGNREYAIRRNTSTQVGSDVTFNLNGHSITNDRTYQDGKSTGYTYLFTTAYDGKLTVNGEGSIRSENADGFVSIFYAQGPSEITINGGNYHAVEGVPVWAGNGTKVTINGGSFTSEGPDQELIYSSGGVIDIYGGFFHNTGWESRPVNVANANRNTGFINIYGGTFVNFDPSSGGDDPGNIRVMDGYKVVSETQANGDVWYTVVPNTVATAEELLNALNNGDKIITYTGTDPLKISNEIKIENDVTITFQNPGTSLDIADGAHLTVAGNANVTIENAVIDDVNSDDAVILVEGGSLTLGKGTEIKVNENMPVSGVIRSYGGKVVLDGTKISGCDNNGQGTLINVATGSELVINDGTVIENNSITGNGGSNSRYALFCVGGKLTMNGGVVRNNEFAHKTLFTIERGSFVMNGGEITGNTFTGTGGASIVYVFVNGSMEMNGGKIADNNLGTDADSAVFSVSSSLGKVTVNGGTVTNNKAGSEDHFAYVNNMENLTIATAATVSGTVAGFGIGPVDVNTLK